MTHRAHIALRTAPGPRVRHRYLKAHSQCRCYALAKGATGAFCSFCGGGDFEKLRETHVVAELERSTKPVALAWDRRANAATATAAGRRADARRRRKREKEWYECHAGCEWFPPYCPLLRHANTARHDSLTHSLLAQEWLHADKV